MVTIFGEKALVEDTLTPIIKVFRVRLRETEEDLNFIVSLLIKDSQGDVGMQKIERNTKN